MRNIRLDLCYDGTRYRGWQRLPGTEDTIQGKLEQALSRILDEQIQVCGSGRTDAGAHALGQVANFHCQSQMPADQILEALRRYLPEDVGIYSCKECAQRFHARLNAAAKTYRYRIWNSQDPCVFQRRYVTVMPEALDLSAMEQAAAHLIGEHDFSAFCAAKSKKKSTLRRLDQIQICRQGPELWLDFTGNGFLYNMARILAGTLVEVGLGRREADAIPALFGAPRSAAGPLLPARGLCLMEVRY